MVDDTCYQLDFDNLDDAKSVIAALNSNEIQSLLQSLTFKDAKRVVTKNLLMRLDLTKLCNEKELRISPSCYPRTSQLSLFEP